MKPRKKEKESNFLKFYLKLSIVFAFIDSLLFFKEFILDSIKNIDLLNIILFILGLYAFLFIIYVIISIIILIRFIIYKYEKVNLIIPLIVIINPLVDMIFRVINRFVNVENLYNKIVYVYLPVNIFLIFFAIYLLKRYRKKIKKII